MSSIDSVLFHLAVVNGRTPWAFRHYVDKLALAILSQYPQQLTTFPEDATRMIHQQAYDSAGSFLTFGIYESTLLLNWIPAIFEQEPQPRKALQSCLSLEATLRHLVTRFDSTLLPRYSDPLIETAAELCGIYYNYIWDKTPASFSTSRMLHYASKLPDTTSDLLHTLQLLLLSVLEIHATNQNTAEEIASLADSIGGPFEHIAKGMMMSEPQAILSLHCGIVSLSTGSDASEALFERLQSRLGATTVTPFRGFVEELWTCLSKSFQSVKASQSDSS